VLWQKPYWNRKPRFFCQNRGEPKPFFFCSQVNTVSPSDVCVQSQWVGSGDETEGAFKVFSVGYIYLFNTWAAMHMLWKCIVSKSNHCEVDRQRSSTQDPFNTIRLWITGRCCTSAHFTFQAAADRCDRRPGARASHYDENKHHVSNDCVCAPRFREICDVILTCTGGGSSQWVSERDGQFENRIAKFHP